MSPKIKRRESIKLAAAVAATAWAAPSAAAPADATVPTHTDTFALLKKGKRIPVIFDTDIGTDIDDTWALLYLINCPELDVRLVSADAGQGLYRARLAAKFLTACGRDDIPVSIGAGRPEDLGHQQDWVGDYSLDSYRGTVHEDSVDAIIKTIRQSEDPVTLVCIGAVPNIAEALRRDPTLCQNARFVGMHGSIHVGYGGSSTPVPEANVRTDPKALREVFAGSWESSVTPLDTCGIIDFDGEPYARILNSTSRGITPLLENYRAWLTRVPWLNVKPDPKKQSSTLFDLVAVYMAYSEELLEMETLGIKVDDDGMTLVDENAPKVRCAMRWRDQATFEDMLVRRLTNRA